MSPPPAARTTNDTARWLAAALMDIGALVLRPDEPFTWASGRRAPIYCDNRLTLGYPDLRGAICRAFAGCIASEKWEVDAIVGTATAGIPHAAWLAGRLNLPMAYVRSSAKGHGRENRVEGRLPSRARVVVVEDLVSTGMSSTAVLPPLEALGCDVLGVMAIFTYALPEAATAFSDAGVPIVTLSSFPVLITVAREKELLGEEECSSLEAWYRDPSAWSVAHGGSN
ncbi:MAG: orotate phosphoribosyltransferase [Bacteroidetes bacterium CG12_big_fil_rev_8_21_14_0_65_60_17]|nr:MAG: orotate phosphoribosyltransferase [Bacteroidetes bacterium CG12_big_fil_rev_8_21_14_0_65_60_17]